MPVTTKPPAGPTLPEGKEVTAALVLAETAVTVEKLATGVVMWLEDTAVVAAEPEGWILVAVDVTATGVPTAELV
jgi:hypothetical protein